ncbi:MAG: peptide-methionine (S)-S-oxide reductase MsrA [Candidatus Woesearchaeota archaeon]
MKATLAGGCFWCLEAVYAQIEGITNIKPGYIKGTKETAKYELVCSGKTEHVEAVQFEFDENKISYQKILEIYFKIHDPTSYQKQGNDLGKQYSAIIFYHNANQKEVAKKELEKQKKLTKKTIYTTLEPSQEFFEAEKYHFNYYQNNKENPYCIYVIKPKIEKIKKV